MMLCYPNASQLRHRACGYQFLTRLGRSYSLILASFGGPKEAQMEPKSLLGPSGEAMLCLTWRLEAS